MIRLSAVLTQYSTQLHFAWGVVYCTRAYNIIVFSKMCVCTCTLYLHCVCTLYMHKAYTYTRVLFKLRHCYYLLPSYNKLTIRVDIDAFNCPALHWRHLWEAKTILICTTVISFKCLYTLIPRRCFMVIYQSIIYHLSII